MDGWRTLKRAIPERAAEAVAGRLGLTANYVRRWRREPESDEAPLATGLRSPLDRFTDLIDAVWLVSPNGVAFIVDHVAGHYHDLIHASFDPEHWTENEKRTDTADLLRETTDAVNALNLDAPAEETLQELMEAKHAIEKAIQKIRNRRPPVWENRPEADAQREPTLGGMVGSREGTGK